MTTKKTEKALSEAFGLPEPKQVEILEPVKQLPVESTSTEMADAEQDYALSRKTFKSLIDKGSDAIDDLFHLAKSSEHPRAFEVLATLIKTVADTTKDLYDLQKKSKDLKVESNQTPQTPGSVNVEQAIFVGSTAELLKRIKEERE